jgi:hypothetical protein
VIEASAERLEGAVPVFVRGPAPLNRASIFWRPIVLSQPDEIR